MCIFQTVEPPGDQRGLPVNRHADWYTWSQSFRCFLKEFRSYLCELPEPQLIRLHLPELGKYNATYTLAVAEVRDSQIRQRLLDFARCLYNLPVPRRIMFFTDLFGEHLDGRGLRTLFSLFRAALAEFAGDQRYAVSAPLQASRQPQEFSLHADLYIPQLLFNVFDDVPVDSTGQSLFLSVATLRRLMSGVASLPAKVQRQILALFHGPLQQDHFEDAFKLLYGKQYPWVEELQRVMAAEQLSIKMWSGQGYLIHDRTWLHGRDTPSAGVSPNRLHRLVFNTAALNRTTAGARVSRTGAVAAGLIVMAILGCIIAHQPRA